MWAFRCPASRSWDVLLFCFSFFSTTNMAIAKKVLEWVIILKTESKACRFSCILHPSKMLKAAVWEGQVLWAAQGPPSWPVLSALQVRMWVLLVELHTGFILPMVLTSCSSIAESYMHTPPRFLDQLEERGYPVLERVTNRISYNPSQNNKTYKYWSGTVSKNFTVKWKQGNSVQGELLAPYVNVKDFSVKYVRCIFLEWNKTAKGRLEARGELSFFAYTFCSS